MTREEAIKVLENATIEPTWGGSFRATSEALDMAIEALEAQKWDEVVFDMNEFFSIVDDGKITVMRKGRGKVTVERPAMRMETTICSYGDQDEENWYDWRDEQEYEERWSEE